ncbi:polyketide synthase [Apiospora marii]|uniref:Polyketide synthase n=1 Tax=Apiospora marii TaxID=335849 RepID=A0ABR1R242_9PEZI
MLSDWSEIFSCRRLNIETDLAEQGFETGSYDTIIACRVLHAMRNVRSFLNPGGKLLLVETTQDQMILQLIFGLMPGWWLSSKGFSGGVKFEVHDCESEEQYSFSTIITTADAGPSLENLSATDPSLLVTYGGLEDETWLRALEDAMAVRTGARVAVADTSSLAIDEVRRTACVFWGKLGNLLLANPLEAVFEELLLADVLRHN